MPCVLKNLFLHNDFSGMICLRDGGTQMSSMIRKYSTKGVYRVHNLFVCLPLLPVGAVFIYTPAALPPPVSSASTASPARRKAVMDLRPAA